MTIKIPTSSILRPFKIYPNWDFWFENKSSGNPADKKKTVSVEIREKHWFHLVQPQGSILYQFRSEFTAGLPDGIFSEQNSRFGKILKSLAVGDVGIL
jgi:hypothetical protein